MNVSSVITQSYFAHVKKQFKCLRHSMPVVLVAVLA